MQTALLDVVVGLLFMYLLMSIAVTSAQESVSAVFHRRARLLRRSLIELLDDENIRQQVLTHPLIRTLGETERRLPSIILPGSGAPGRAPSHIPPEAFVLALLDAIPAAPTPTPAQATQGEELATKQPTTPDSVAVPRDHIANVRQFVQTTSNDVSTTMRVLLEHAEHDLDRFKAGLAAWFDATMERTTIWYKRNTQYQVIAITVVLTVWGNVDSFAVINSLWRDPALRGALVAQAQNAVSQPPRTQPLPVALASTTGTAPAPPCYPPEDDPQNGTEDQFDRRWNELMGLGLPIGWARVPDTFSEAAMTHAGGWLLTILAVSLGAPFWFDVLKKIVSVRYTGVPSAAPPKQHFAPSIAKRPRVRRRGTRATETGADGMDDASSSAKK